jgi:hypothetical protein
MDLASSIVIQGAHKQAQGASGAASDQPMAAITMKGCLCSLAARARRLAERRFEFHRGYLTS